MTPVGHASLIVKATRLCNLRCAYCHDWRAGPDQTMPFGVLARMTASVLRAKSLNAVEFIWHGGETTVLPPAFYEKAMQLQARYRRPGQIVRNAIQTNGTRLDDDWIRLFRRYEFSVGISLDGPPEIHDRHRRYRNGAGSSRDVADGMTRLRDGKVAHSVLMVVDEATLAAGPRRIFDFLLESGIRSIGFIAAKPINQPDARPGTPTSHYTDPATMSRFLADLYDLWLEHGDRSLRIRELRAIEHRLRQSSAGLCTFAGTCFGHYFLVEPHGEVAHCDLFDGDVRYTLGNLATIDFDTVVDGPELRPLRDQDDVARARMSACPEFHVCNGWCPHERYLSQRHYDRHDEGCCGLRELIQHVRSRSRVPRARSLQP